MVRSALASATAVLALLLLSAAPATARSHRAACHAAHRASAAPSETRSFRQAHCPKRGVHLRRRHSKPAYLPYFTARHGVCPDAYLRPTARNVAAIRAATLCLVNRERAVRGERPLHWNLRLVASAQNHTESMAFRGYFRHVGPRGETPLSRMRSSGYIYSSRLGFEVAENIGWGSLWLGTPRAVVSSWMNSPGHRANILDERFVETGIGVSPHVAGLAGGRAGGIYTQDFGVLVS